RILQIHGFLVFEDDLDGFAELLEKSHFLDTIDLRARVIRYLDPLTRIPPLRKLTLTFGRISDISPLQDQPSLEYINLDGNEITDISPLLNMPNLRQVILVSNPLSEESRNSHLPELRLRGVIVAAD
ncbi:MAG: leucine-rich repeat domain-containing protein, partial [SAR202 cluster bacterium]|nr:leucine-rich repeat domain-containing protein [SAR202 cluster bacterium]